MSIYQNDINNKRRILLNIISSMEFIIFISLVLSTRFVFGLQSTSTVNKQHSFTQSDKNLERTTNGNGLDGGCHNGWDIIDWWQDNIQEDLYNAFRPHRSLVNEAPMGRFVQLIEDRNPTDSFVYQRRYSRPDYDLETSDSMIEEERIELSEAVTIMAILKNQTDNETERVSEQIVRPPEEKRRPSFGTNSLSPVPRPPIPSQRFPTNFDSTNSGKLWGFPNPDRSFSAQEFRETFVPKSSFNSIKSFFYDYFTNIRTNLYDQHVYLNLKRNLRAKFIEYGLQTAIQSFYHNRRNDKGHNIVGIYPGIHRNHSSKDSILVIGAHYDTVAKSPGVEDNGSGSVAVLEIARLLHKHQCKLNTTIIFVLFDMEEDGLIGSKHFVRNYLIPVEIEKNHVPVKGAIIMDMLLEYDTSVNSQLTYGIGNILPDWYDRVRQNRYRADFTAVWARRNIDSDLYRTLQSNWQNSHKYKLLLMDPPLPKLGRHLTSGLASKRLRPYSTFLRSDHSSFWYPHTTKNATINAILLTDLGPWRRKVADKYHSSLDNSKLLSKANLLFLMNAIDSILKTVLDIGDGHCVQTNGKR